MRKLWLGFQIFVFLTFSCVAAAESLNYHMRVAKLLGMVDGTPYTPPLPPSVWTPQLTSVVSKDEALLYLHGVIDGGEGVRWCVSRSPVAPPERYDVVFNALRNVKNKEGNAALAIGEILSKGFPCRGTKTKGE